LFHLFEKYFEYDCLIVKLNEIILFASGAQTLYSTNEYALEAIRQEKKGLKLLL